MKVLRIAISPSAANRRWVVQGGRRCGGRDCSSNFNTEIERTIPSRNRKQSETQARMLFATVRRRKRFSGVARAACGTPSFWRAVVATNALIIDYILIYIPRGMITQSKSFSGYAVTAGAKHMAEATTSKTSRLRASIEIYTKAQTGVRQGSFRAAISLGEPDSVQAFNANQRLSPERRPHN
jgi:hypothetical protein